MSDLVPRLGDALDALRGDSTRIPREVVRAIERERARALIEAIRDDNRATRARRLTQHTALLSADEAAYLRWAPLGEARYQLMADAYAIAEASKIMQS